MQQVHLWKTGRHTHSPRDHDNLLSSHKHGAPLETAQPLSTVLYPPQSSAALTANLCKASLQSSSAAAPADINPWNVPAGTLCAEIKKTGQEERKDPS